VAARLASSPLTVAAATAPIEAEPVGVTTRVTDLGRTPQRA
jgi:hypothetical protein